MNPTKTKSLSANTLFHFTSSINNLISIIVNDFYPRYSLEFYSEFLEEHKNIAIPMVSFCDIPLSQIKNHSEIYGNYALGLSKQWGIKNSVSPVIYVYKNSKISELYQKIENDLLLNEDANIDSESRVLITEIYGYLKSYDGELWRDGKRIQNKVRFYDEREWRYIPSFDLLVGNRIKRGLTFEVYKDKRLRDEENKLMEKNRLCFTPNDIKYVIVDKEYQVSDMLDMITKIKGNKYNYNDVNLLTTRIISMDKIIDDF
jgi:hypothetical protein